MKASDVTKRIIFTHCKNFLFLVDYLDMRYEAQNKKHDARKKTLMLRTSCIMLLLILLFPPYVFSKDKWELLYQPRQRVVKIVAVYNNSIFIGTGNGVLVSKDNGKTWDDFGTNKLQKDNSGNSTVNWIHIDEDSKRIYIATSFGAYYSDADIPNWYKLFESTKTGSNTIDLTTEDVDLSDDDDRLSKLEEDDDFSQGGQVNSITIDNEQVYLATNDGFWICDLNLEKKCQRINEGLEPDSVSGNHEVFYTLKVQKNLFLSTSNGIYIFDHKNSRWIKISATIQKLDNGRINARYLYLDKEQNLWALCGTGIYKSSNEGKSWERVSNGIKKNNDGFQEAYYLFESEDKLYVACASGVYFLNKENNFWQDISGGIKTKESSKNIYWLTSLNNDLYAATDEGLFVSRIPYTVYREKSDGQEIEGEVPEPRFLEGKIETGFLDLERFEPTVSEVQKQALQFAALPTANDYRRYRAQARLRNIIPKVGFDLNTTGTNTNYYQFENGISTATSSSNDYNAGNTKRFQHDGKSYQQLSVSWDGNQLLYDDQIWRILNQARLTANIKENLLDDITRIYFQRKRLQLESLTNPEPEERTILAKKLEIDELTGQLDSRTGGWFSKEIERRKRKV